MINNQAHFCEFKSTYSLREFKNGDEINMSELYQRSISQLACQNYSSEQIETWLSLTPNPEVFTKKYSDGRNTVVAVDENNQIAGFSDLEMDGHIDFFYVCPNHARRGIGSAMLNHIVSLAIELHIPKLYAEASGTALSSFLRQGFKKVSRRDLNIDGVDIHNYAVEKLL